RSSPRPPAPVGLRSPWSKSTTRRSSSCASRTDPARVGAQPSGGTVALRLSYDGSAPVQTEIGSRGHQRRILNRTPFGVSSLRSTTSVKSPSSYSSHMRLPGGYDVVAFSTHQSPPIHLSQT